MYDYHNEYRALPAFHSFVDPLQGIGGGDGPEDIMGAFRTTFSNLSWETSECSKVTRQSVCCIQLNLVSLHLLGSFSHS